MMDPVEQALAAIFNDRAEADRLRSERAAIVSDGPGILRAAVMTGRGAAAMAWARRVAGLGSEIAATGQ